MSFWLDMHCLLMVVLWSSRLPWQHWCLKVGSPPATTIYLKIFANPNPTRTVSRKSAGSLTRMFISIYIINLYIERGRGRERGREGESQTSVTLFCGFKQLGAPVVEAVSRQHTKWLTIFLLWLLIFLCIYHVYVWDLYLFVCLFVCLLVCVWAWLFFLCGLFLCVCT